MSALKEALPAHLDKTASTLSEAINVLVYVPKDLIWKMENVEVSELFHHSQQGILQVWKSLHMTVFEKLIDLHGQKPG